MYRFLRRFRRKMAESNNRQRFVEKVRETIGSPYVWGGQSILSGFDCSGVVIWSFNQIGKPLQDMTAKGLFDHYHRCKKMINLAEPGDLMFYSSDNVTVDHVMIVNRVWVRSDWPVMTLIGARGGDDKCNTPMISYLEGAMVDVVKGEYWKSNFVGLRDPFMI